MMKTRKYGIDLLKIISCVGVVGLHVFINGFDKDNLINWNSYIYYLCTISIPIFFLVNGYFILNKSKLEGKYLIKKIILIVKIVTIWNALFWILTRKFDDNILKKIIGSLVQRGYFPQFWFLGSLIIIYLSLPWLKKLLRNHTIYTKIVLGLFLIGVGIQFASYYLSVPLQSYVPQTFRLWTWYFYFFMGGWLGREDSKTMIHSIVKYIKFIVPLVFVLPIFIIVIVNYRYNNIYAEYFYDGIIIKLVSISIFLLFLNLKIEIIKVQKMIHYGIGLTMGIYIVHYHIIKYLIHYFFEHKIISNLLFIMTLVLSLVIVSIVKKMKYINKVFEI